jgi:hypothetical protein
MFPGATTEVRTIRPLSLLPTRVSFGPRRAAKHDAEQERDAERPQRAIAAQREKCALIASS